MHHRNHISDSCGISRPQRTHHGCPARQHTTRRSHRLPHQPPPRHASPPLAPRVQLLNPSLKPRAASRLAARVSDTHTLPTLLNRLDLTPSQRDQLLATIKPTTHGPSTPHPAPSPDHAAANLRHLLTTYPRAQVKHLLLARPAVLATATPAADWLAFLAAYGFTPAESLRLLSACAPAWASPAHTPFSAGTLLLTLQSASRLPPAALRARALLPAPALLTTPPAQVSALLDALSALGCTPPHLAHLLTTHPRLLPTATAAALAAKLRLLAHHGVTPAALPTFLPPVLPKFLATPPGTLAATLQFLDSIGLRGRPLERLLAACPPVIATIAVTDLVDKWGFLTRVMGLGLSDLLRYPGFLERDLMCSIRPRYLLLEHVLEGGPAEAAAAIARGQAEQGPLAWLLDCDDAGFCARLGVTQAEYVRFYNDLVTNQYYGVKAAVDVHDRPEPHKG